MITAYTRTDGKITAALLVKVGEDRGPILHNSIWVDVQDPTLDEVHDLYEHLGVTLPSRGDNWRNQTLNRLYVEDKIAYMSASVLYNVSSNHPKTRAITVILTPTCLITVRHIYPTAFGYFQQRLLQHPEWFLDGSDILEGLVQEMFTRVGWHMEMLVDGLDDLSQKIFDEHAFENKQGNPSILMRQVLQKLGALADLNAKIHESLQSLQRLLVFYRKAAVDLTQKPQPDIETLIKDADGLIIQTNFLSDKISFQLDAALGMINVEQNLISKIFSIVAVFFMPPTLISSIYGMNFAHMPELAWGYGSPMAIGLRISAAVITDLYFKRQGWL